MLLGNMPPSVDRFRNRAVRLLCATALFSLAACSIVPEPYQRRLHAENLAGGHSWRRVDLGVSPFQMVAWLPERSALPGSAADNRLLTVYLEGDGLAWRSRTRRSSDPTPVTPVALNLALLDPSPNVAYLARPCQYVDLTRQPLCEPKFWTSHRFAPVIVAAVDAALSRLKAETEASRLQLVGYSGGGALATLLAARRDDIVAIRTVAGNLDHELWTRTHTVDPLSGSLNPVDDAVLLRAIPQIHYVGTRDRVVPRSLAESFLAAQGAGGCATLVDVMGATHSSGWDVLWPTLLKMPLSCPPEEIP